MAGDIILPESEGLSSMDILRRLKELQQQRGWSDYKIAKEAGLSPNTVSNIYRRNSIPSMTTLEMLCKAFGITMAQFFVEGEMVELTQNSVNCLINGQH